MSKDNEKTTFLNFHNSKPEIVPAEFKCCCAFRNKKTWVYGCGPSIPSCPHSSPPSNFSNVLDRPPPLRKSRTAERTRCDCFHTQEVITPDLPQLWLRLINIDKQLMRCQAGTRPFPSCPPMTPMERKNDLDLAMSLSFIRVQRGSLIIFSRRAGLSTVQPDSPCSDQQNFGGVLSFIIRPLKVTVFRFLFRTWILLPPVGRPTSQHRLI